MLRFATAAAVTALITVLSACGTSDQVVKTVTVESSQAPASTDVEPAGTPKRKPAQASASPRTPKYIDCDPNIRAKTDTTTCEFAQNTFWHYWTSGESDVLEVWSPAAHTTFTTSCQEDGSEVVCSADDGGEVRIAYTAIDAYDEGQADAYAASHDLGPDPYENSSPAAPAYDDYEPAYDDYEYEDYEDYDSYAVPDADSYGEDIPNYENGRGYRVQCADGMYSQSGGIQGACSGHGGVR